MMPRIFSNGPGGDYVVKPFERLLLRASCARLAAPYFTRLDAIRKASEAGIPVQLVVGLNQATSPDALGQAAELPGVSIRFFTDRFHAKLYLFGEDDVLLGSSNLTDGGMIANREAVIALDASVDRDAVEEARALFAELWESARVLTPTALRDFRVAWKAIDRRGPDPDASIARAVGPVAPSNVDVASRGRPRERLFLRDLRRQVHEQYRPAFREVSVLLETASLRRETLADSGLAAETNRFLNWVRLTQVTGEEGWSDAPLRPKAAREAEVRRLGAIWQTTADDKVHEDFYDRLARVRTTFATPEAIAEATRDGLTLGLLGVHAFLEQLRFVKGGEAELPAAFWNANGGDVMRVKGSLTYLVHGPGDLIERLHDLLYDSRRKLGHFGYFCALELFGTVRPDDCPPINGRMAKALRFLGHDVRPQ